ncbi:MAG: flavin reductase family protein [Chloroflexi bacterium]|nr:flavin reductase family protein [Chloroflexota bacterium]
MISITPNQLSPRDAYRLLNSTVVPRPIAWVSTIGADGSINLAPFSFFNAVSGNPPTVMFSISQRAGKPKDTLRNAQATGEFVVNLVDESLAAKMNQTSGDWAYGTNEFEIAQLETAPSLDVQPPRVARAPIALEARVSQIVPVLGTPNTLILGHVVRWHIRDDLLRPNGLIDATRLHPIARLGGDEYATLAAIFEMTRPTV